MFGRILSCAFIASLLIQPLSASEILERMEGLHKKSTEIQELAVQSDLEARKKIGRLLNEFKSQSGEFGGELVRDDQWKEFAKIYRSLDGTGREDMKFVVKRIKSLLFHEGMERDPASFREEFPGWGHGKPGFVYRRGKETRRDLIQAYWKDEHREEKINHSKKLKVDISLVAKLKIQFPELIEGLKFQVDIDGKLVWVQEVSFNKEVKIVSNTKVKMGIEKVWHELWEAKKKFWGSPKDWKLVGETYTLSTNPTGQEVIVDASVEPVS